VRIGEQLDLVSTNKAQIEGVGGDALSNIFGVKFHQIAKNRNRMGIFCHSILYIYIYIKSPNLPQKIFLENCLPHLDFDFSFIDL
jgi:hypothetical protein